MATPSVLLDLLDLVLGRRCLGCDRSGRPLCSVCLTAMRGQTRQIPAREPLPPVVAAIAYDAMGRRAILEYKERGCRSLAPMLGVLLADALQAHARRLGSASVIVVPVPSHRHAARGFDALGGIVAAARRDLERRGVVVAVRRPLRSAAPYRPLKGLGRSDRQAQVAGAFRPVAHGPGPRGAGPLILVDDVVTSGATAGEAVRCLRSVGLRVDGVAAIAAVSRGTWATIPGPARPMHRP